MPSAVERLLAAIDRKERIVLYGDYDVDGVTSLALLSRILRAYGADPACFLPSRVDEGYGMSPDGVARCVSEHAPQLARRVDELRVRRGQRARRHVAAHDVGGSAESVAAVRADEDVRVPVAVDVARRCERRARVGVVAFAEPRRLVHRRRVASRHRAEDQKDGTR